MAAGPEDPEDRAAVAAAAAEDPAVEDTDMNLLKPGEITFKKNAAGMLDIIMPERTVEDVHCMQLFPLSDSQRYISVVRPTKPDPEEIGIIESLADLSHEQQKLVVENIKFRYFVPEIEDIVGVDESAGLYEMDMKTERGPRRVFIMNPRENISTTDNGVMLITDVEKCRYKITRFSKLSPRAHAQFEKIVF
ncbi:MAG TPA: DUF1854 domain-containing protein [Sedimentisphaerales bacterium]|nr:DUF1854 domain-containing protein [Sedimentisphaerales bacterium]